jgi:protein involved in polysaccharide export with SLBB domain
MSLNRPRLFARAGALTLSVLFAALSPVPGIAQTGGSIFGQSSVFGAGEAASSPSGGQTSSPSSSSSGNSSATTTPSLVTPNRTADETERLQDNKALQDALELQRLRRMSATPPKPGEFQRFVEAATGRPLPLFGSRFFEETAAGFAPVDNVPVSSDYTVGPGDEIMVRIWGSLDSNLRVRVDRNGQISLPKVGTFTVAGVRASELQDNLRGQISRIYTNFNLSVALGALRSVKVFVVGPARLPGVLTLSSQSTMLSAVVAAGGPAPNGSMRKVLLRRGSEVVSELDIYDFLVLGDKSKDLQLVAGDVIVFQSAGPRVALNGAIDNPAIYELKAASEPVADVLRYAGGAAVLTNPNKVQIERIDARKAPAARFVEEFKLDEGGLQKTLRDGDIVTLLAISPQFANAVTLRGHVAQPLRYAYTPGMRIRDLIPDKDALITPDFYRRKNLLVQTVEDDTTKSKTNGRSSATDQPATASDPSAPNAAARTAGNAPTARDNEQASNELTRKSPVILFDELNWDYAVIERLNDQDLTTQVIPFNLGMAVLKGDAANNVELRAGDVVTVFSQKDIRVPVARQTRLVAVEGEVGAPGVYQLRAGETLRQLISRAGGFTPHAYVFGLEFTREETRKKQSANLAVAIQRLEALSATQTARAAANQRDDVAGDRATAVSTAATQAQLTRLRGLQPSGRIALELPPTAATVDDLPDLPLEQSDRVVVPARPGFVTVAGAVVNTNALLWKRGRTVDDYLKQVGVDEGAEVSNMFVLRADGTVSHAKGNGGFLGWGGIGSQTLEPGDAIVVPSQLDYETWGRALVRNLKDWSQIFAQFGLGAAAIQTLRNN